MGGAGALAAARASQRASYMSNVPRASGRGAGDDGVQLVEGRFSKTPTTARALMVAEGATVLRPGGEDTDYESASPTGGLGPGGQTIASAYADASGSNTSIELCEVKQTEGEPEK